MARKQQEKQDKVVEAQNVEQPQNTEAIQEAVEENSPAQENEEENTPPEKTENPPLSSVQTTPVSEEKESCKDISDLALQFRIPTWQQAALVRMMGWAEGKQVTESDYEKALEKLAGRPIGGGRK